MTETDRIRERYARRERSADELRYDPLRDDVLLMKQERERVLVRCLRAARLQPLDTKRVLDVGCGGGMMLASLIQLGFAPEGLVGIELLEEPVRIARERLPTAVRIIQGDATEIDESDGSFDVVMQWTVFSSILDDAFARRLASRMWNLLRPGGSVIWYDFAYDNPRNPDVRGVPVSRVRTLFPGADVTAWRVTLAPPIARRVASVHPCLYGVFNAVPALRSHRLCWLRAR